MADFKTLISELAAGNESVETILSWMDDAIASGQESTDSLMQQIDSMSNLLPAEFTSELKNHLRGESPGNNDAPLEFDFSLELPAEQPAEDPDKTVIDTGGPAGGFGELSLEPTADSDKTEIVTQDNDKTQVVATHDSDRTVVVEQPANDKTEVVRQDTDATIVNTDDPTIRGGQEMDPFAMATQPGNNSAPTGTGWPAATTNMPGGRGSSLDPKSIGPGTILKDRFELLSAIGEGGMGMVYKARDLLKVEAKDRNPYIAVKLLSGDFREHPEAFIALQRESSKAQKLAHPNITTVYDFDRDGSTVYLTMELMEGQELAQYIKKLPPGGLPVDDALKIVQQLCEGLDYAHARGLVHSDFKPGNCFILNDGTVKILDFGIARASKARTDAEGETTVFDPGQLGALTPAYATPEMFEGMDPAPEDDIYALGCVAYELLTGKHPFNKLSSVKAMEKGLSPAPVNKPGFTKRQSRALLRSLSFKRSDRTSSVKEFWDGVQFKKNYLPQIIGGGIAATLLIGALAYTPIIQFLEDRKNAEIIAQLNSGTLAVPEVLNNLGTFSERAAKNLKEDARDLIIKHFEDRAEFFVDETQNRYDYPSALEVIAEARQYYPDSAQVNAISTDLENRRNVKVAELTDTFNNYLGEDRIMPLDEEDDITDVLSKMRQADPGNPILTDARLTKRYEQLAEQAITADQWQQAKSLVTAGLIFSKEDASLLNLDDQVTRELKRQADAKLVAEIEGRLAAARPNIRSASDFAPHVDDLAMLEQIRPDSRILVSMRDSLRSNVSGEIQRLTAAGDWASAEQMLFTFSRMFPINTLIEQRNQLSRAEVASSYQPADLTERLQQLEQRHERMKALLANPTFDFEWNNELERNFKESTALLRPGNTWYGDLQQRIVSAYVDQAGKLIAADRFDAASRMLDIGQTYDPAKPIFDQQREKLAEAKLAFDRAQAEKIRIAEIAAKKNQLDAQAKANDMASAVKTFQELKDELPADDAFVTTEGPELIATAFLRIANTQGERGQYSNAVTAAKRGLEFRPDMEGLKEAVNKYDSLAQREDLMKLASNATPSNVGDLPGSLSNVKKLFPADATAITSEAIRGLADRIKRLESSDVTMANELWAEAKKLFPGERALESLTLRAPPRPSKYVPTARTAMQRAELTKASEILATAQQEEPGNEQVTNFARELADAKAQLAPYFAEYKKEMLANNKSRAKQYLDYVISKWKDNPEYQAELSKNFTTTVAPTRAADGSKPCTASLAGFGRSGRAVCFDMLSQSERGPDLVVVPAGGSFSKPFAIAKYEISVAEYNYFCATSKSCGQLSGDSKLPATNISVQTMQAYADWLTSTTGKQYRIPTSQEWTYASNANNPNAVRDFNCRVTQGSQVLKGLTMLEIKSGRANPWGLTNYVGNAQEVVKDGATVTVRGGAFDDNLSNCSIELTKPYEGPDSRTGFRVVRDSE